MDDNHTCGLLLRPSPDKSDAAMVFSLPISTSMSDSVSPGDSIFKLMLSLTFQRTWVSAPLVVVPVNCSQCQIVQSIRAKIWVTPESIFSLFWLFSSNSPFSIAGLVELFQDIASPLDPQIATLLAKPPHLSGNKEVNHSEWQKRKRNSAKRPL